MKVLKFIFISFIFIVVISIISGTTSEDTSQRTVTKEQYGDKWPLIVNSGLLKCDRGAIVFIHNGIKYAVNGIAMGRGYPDIEPIWKDHPSGYIPKISIRPLINDGLKLCN